MTRMTIAGVAVLAALIPAAAFAQTARPADAALTVPTTKVLAIGSFTAKGTPEAVKPVLLQEVRETVKIYLTGKLEQWYVKPDQSGVVFLMNVSDPGEAHALLAQLPFGQAGLMDFQFIPLGPISPLRLLLAEPGK
ncbi:hypothetical protein BH11PSE4_BH11PSE4_09990 [soil metagenome]